VKRQGQAHGCQDDFGWRPSCSQDCGAPAPTGVAPQPREQHWKPYQSEHIILPTNHFFTALRNALTDLTQSFLVDVLCNQNRKSRRVSVRCIQSLCNSEINLISDVKVKIC